MRLIARRWWLAGLLLVAAVVVSADDCSGSSSNQVEQSSQASQQTIYNHAQPLPIFPYSSYRQEMIDLERILATGNVKTWTVYTLTMTGDLQVCPSQGYPIPVTTQLSNPVQADRTGSYTGGAPVAVGQMDPTGVYSPPTGTGTWIMCLANDGLMHPVYAEGFTTAFPWPVAIRNGQVVQVGEPDASTAVHGCPGSGGKCG